MKRLFIVCLFLASLTLIGCDGSSKQMTQAECQQQYDVNKNKALDAYESCSKANCNGQVIMTQGQDVCTQSCFEDLKAARADLDATISDCMSNAIN